MNNSMEWKSFVESKNKTFDLIQIPGVSETSISPIPDAAILFRCSDILHGDYPSYELELI